VVNVRNDAEVADILHNRLQWLQMVGGVERLKGLQG